MVEQSWRNQGHDQQGRPILHFDLQSNFDSSTAAEQTGGRSRGCFAGATAARFSETFPDSGWRGADTARTRGNPAKSTTTGSNADPHSAVERGGIVAPNLSEPLFATTFGVTRPNRHPLCPVDDPVLRNIDRIYPDV